MRWFREIRRRIAMLRHREDFERELDAEMRCHLELQAEENESRGMSPREARWAAQRQFGNAALLAEDSRSAWGWTAFDNFFQDVRYAIRRLSASKSYTLTAIVILALGIGANTGLFTLMHAVMLKSLPIADPETVVRLGDGDNCCGLGWQQGRYSLFSDSFYKHLRDHTPDFEGMAAFQAGFGRVGVRRAGMEVSEGLVRQFVSGNYFEVLGLRAYAGRLTVPADDQQGAPAVAVISYRAWQQQYGGDPSVVGAAFTIEGFPVTVVGVAPPAFFGTVVRTDPPDFWLPIATEPAVHGGTSLQADRRLHWLYVIGRLRPGVQASNVEAGLNVKLQTWLRENEQGKTEDLAKQHIALVPGGSGISQMRERYRQELTLLLGMTTLVLLIACANLANLQLARGAVTATQSSVRVALGASRYRLIRQVLVESIILSIVGGAAGMFVAWQSSGLLIQLVFRGSSVVPIDTTPSPAVLWFTLGVSVLAGILFGLVPALATSRSSPSSMLRSLGRSATGRSMRPQRVLLVAQIALSVVLLTAAGLMAQSLRNLTSQGFGFQVDGAVSAAVDANFGGYAPEKLAALYADIDRRMRDIPGVRNAALALYAPMSGDNWGMNITLEEKPLLEAGSSWNRVSPSFFDTIGARILRGRGFDETVDRPGSTAVTVVNEEFAKTWFPHEDPIGKRFGIGGYENRGDYMIVGVVNSIRFRRPRQPGYPMFFLPLLQMSPADWKDEVKARSNVIGSVLLRVEGSPRDLVSQVTRSLGSVDPNLTPLKLTSLPELLAQQLGQEHTISALAQVFGVLALILSCVGLYGLTDYSVSQRRSEIGMRTALGATRQQVVLLVLKGAVTQTAAGLAVGVVGSLVTARLLTTLVYGVQPSDPLSIAGACVVLALFSLTAALLPALRASHVDPAVTLRTE